MFKIAIYGKGGIGKSTITSNISYILSSQGEQTIQIGCDPKHDSTRSLLGGTSQTTVLDYLHETHDGENLDDIVVIGSGGVRCIEAGGPEPGIGCAGRGILTTLEFLNRHGIMDQGASYIIYDVLGDVVCGGFGVPLRKGYADAVYIVTSGEFMSLYAANNILKGLLNYYDGTPKVGGLILNCRGMENEIAYVKNFADAVGLPIVSIIPRDRRFSEAESKGAVLIKSFPDCEAAKMLKAVASDIREKADDRTLLKSPHPLDDDAMDKIAKGIPIDRNGRLVHRRAQTPTNECWTLRSCAGLGAVMMLRMVNGIHTIIHGPSSCAYLMCRLSDHRNAFRDIHGGAMSIWERVSCTCLTNDDAVFGGETKLRALIRRRHELGDRCIAVISMCVPGIIGDRTEDICTEMSEELGTKILSLPLDGIATGGLSQGIIYAFNAIVDLVDETHEKDEHLINVMGEFRAGTERMAYMDDSTKTLINAAGFDINTVFPGFCTLEDIRNLGRAKYAVISNEGAFDRGLFQPACRKLGITLMENHLPRSRKEMEDWFDEASSLTGSDLSLQKSEAVRSYESGISEIRDRIEGSKVATILVPGPDYRWLFDILDDLRIEVVCKQEAPMNRWTVPMNIISSANPEADSAMETAVHSGAELILTNYRLNPETGANVWNFVNPYPGIEGAAYWAEKLEMALRIKSREAWR